MKTLFNLLLVFTFLVQVQAQEKTIVGIVSDESGIPLPGASIIIKGSNIGTQTNFDGLYKIKAKSSDVLVFSFLGYKTEERKVGTLNTISVNLKEDVSKLEEVVVVGYGYSTHSYTPSAAQIKREKQKAYHNSLAKQIQSVPVGPG